MSRAERFTKPPHSLHVKQKDRHLSIVERHLALMRLQEEDRRLEMTSEDEIIEHLMDWRKDESYDDDGFPIQTRYQISDSVPDVFVRPIEKKEPEKVPVEPLVEPAPSE